MNRQQTLASLRAKGFRPSRGRGQNFLFDVQLLDAFIRDAQVPPGMAVLEVGAGAGTLTARLIEQRCRPLVTVEIEPVLIAYLVDQMNPGVVLRPDTAAPAISDAPPELTLVAGDALSGKNRLSPVLGVALARLAETGHDRLYLVANLPYAIATPLLQLLLERESPRLDGVGVLVQLEAAERWGASPGSKNYGAISILLALLGTSAVRRRVARQLFSPQPQVDSAFFTWRRAAEPRCDDATAISVLRFARSLFTRRRKMLRASLAEFLTSDAIASLDWERIGVSPTDRAEAVSPEAFVRLFAAVSRQADAAD